jgi:Schlafen group 3, DNA/RNA helicase domain
MKAINLTPLIQAFKSLDSSTKDGYFLFLEIAPRNDELVDLEIFMKYLNGKDPRILNGYFLNYSIPQISKEFDLLRFGKDSIVNIELKRESTIDRIAKQLARNKYYLEFLGKEIHSYTFVTDEQKLYSLDSNGKLLELGIGQLIKVLEKQEVIEVPNINHLFNPSNYLVSPVNSTDKFVLDEYFLTDHQEWIKTEIVKLIHADGASFSSIYGKAGTGKTLLTYDVVKEFQNTNMNVLIVHCGMLNEGHVRLNNEYNWHVVAIRDLGQRKLVDYQLIIVDEAQRIYPSQLELIIKHVKENRSNCIFSYDDQQCLRQWEVNNNIPQMITEKSSATNFKLTEKIRTNKELATFIKALFDKSRGPSRVKIKNVDLNYFDKVEDAEVFLQHLYKDGWEVINYTPDNKRKLPYDNYSINHANNAHEVIGQEFDKVVAVIDSYFYYKDDQLDIKKYTPYYDQIKMLFQIVTRVRKKLNIVIIGNPEMLVRCLNIIGINIQES